MGSFFADVLSFDHEIALYDIDPHRLRFAFNTLRMTRPEEIQDFTPDLVINAATVKYTIEAFQTVLPYLPAHTILSDIASVKTGLPEFYAQARHPFVSTHPMFGPTFANLSDLSTQNTIIITEGDHMGKIFFKDIYQRLRLNIFEYSFKEHDETIAYSLSVHFDAGVRLDYETSRGSRHDIQKTYGHSKRATFGRRLPANRNSFQSQYPRSSAGNTEAVIVSPRYYRA